MLQSINCEYALWIRADAKETYKIKKHTYLRRIIEAANITYYLRD